MKLHLNRTLFLFFFLFLFIIFIAYRLFYPPPSSLSEEYKGFILTSVRESFLSLKRQGIISQSFSSFPIPVSSRFKGDTVCFFHPIFNRTLNTSEVPFLNGKEGWFIGVTREKLLMSHNLSFCYPQSYRAVYLLTNATLSMTNESLSFLLQMGVPEPSSVEHYPAREFFLPTTPVAPSFTDAYLVRRASSSLVFLVGSVENNTVLFFYSMPADTLLQVQG